MVKTILSLIFALLLGYSLTHFPFDITLPWEIWIVISFVSGVGVVSCLWFSFEPKIKPPFVDDQQADLNRFQNEFKSALRAHLKVSILFWSHYYQKTKVKTFEDAKKEVFQDLKKEFPHVRWMESMIEDIRQELAKYK